MSSGPEKHVENSIRILVQERGGWVIKIFANEMQGVGYPDLLLCYKGYFLAFETKAPNGKTAKIQQSTLQKIRNALGVAISVRSLNRAREVLDYIDSVGPPVKWEVPGG